MSDGERFIGFANYLADAAGKIILSYFRTGIDVETKEDGTPVTIADRKAELAMRELIEAEYPNHRIQGEEFPAKQSDSDWVWYLDPIDGTKSFVCGVPLFGTLISLVKGGVPVLGLIDQPYLGERWIGLAGRPTTLNGEKVEVAACTAVSEARLFTTGMEYYRADQIDSVERLKRSAAIRRYSADCYAFAMLAIGNVDIVIEGCLREHDVAAIVPVIEGAGGIITDWGGQPLRFEGQLEIPSVIACGDRAIHESVINLLSF